MSAVLTWFHLKFQAQGGDGLLQRIKRIIYDAKSTVVVSLLFFVKLDGALVNKDANVLRGFGNIFI